MDTMAEEPPKKNPNDLKLITQELKDPYKQLNSVFLLISVIPILSCLYIFFGHLTASERFYREILPIIFFSNLIVLLGYIAGYRVVQNILKKILDYELRARNADRLKSTFAQELAHDLKNPLSVIKANMSNMKAGLLGTITPKQDEAAAVCKNTADRMGHLLTNLIQTYNIQARTTKPELSHFNLSELVDEERRAVDAVAQTKKLNLTAALSKKALTINADKAMMLRVIDNLLNNAIKFTPPGERIIIKCYPKNGFARLEVLNSGTLIPEHMLETIFSKFERADRSVEGQGLGLAIARDIVELHQGKIWASITPEKLNSFTVLLPLVQN